MEFIAKLFLFHEFVLLPISAYDVAALRDVEDYRCDTVSTYGKYLNALILNRAAFTYLCHESLRNVGADKSCATTNADFDDSIGSNFLWMCGFKLCGEIVSHRYYFLSISRSQCQVGLLWKYEDSCHESETHQDYKSSEKRILRLIMMY
jgi:hypothetical protein